MKNKISKRFVIIIIIFGTLLLVIGCSSVTETKLQNENKSDVLQQKLEAKIELTNATPSVKNLLKEYPYLISSFNEIPLKYQDTVVVPTLSEIPFEIKEVEIDYQRHNDVDVAFKGNDRQIVVSVWRWDKPLSNDGEEIHLNKDITGIYYFENNQMGIHWRDPVEGSALLYGVGLVNLEFEPLILKENEFTKEDAINIANSMIDNHTLDKK